VVKDLGLEVGIECIGFRVEGSGSRSETWFRVLGTGFRIQGSRFRVQGAGFRVQGSGFRVQSTELRVLVLDDTSRTKIQAWPHTPNIVDLTERGRSQSNKLHFSGFWFIVKGD